MGRVDQGGQIVEIGSATTFNPDWRLYARSASDDKSPIVALCAALDVLKSSGLSPSVNLRVILDGEEEASPRVSSRRLRVPREVPRRSDGDPRRAHSLERTADRRTARGDVTFNLTVYGPSVGGCTAGTTATGFQIPRSAWPPCSRA